jgi:uridine kinase
VRTGPEADAIVDLALERDPTDGIVRLICIDGPAGSGKTSLAAVVAGRATARGLDCSVIHMDDLYEGWEGLELGPERRVDTQLLAPLSQGTAARWQRYDWDAGRFGEWVDQRQVDVLVLEGCGAGATAYAAYRTVLVWVEAARDTRIARAIRRDGEQVLPRWLAWMDSEARHFAANATRAHADLAYSTDAR